mmetsp:Transcript_34265/g.68530  ORF Transcript_34265/g.68530 Transcript_34265/m.68530 type:complete len:101 (-) Transcript_34265:17-319(-)
MTSSWTGDNSFFSFFSIPATTVSPPASGGELIIRRLRIRGAETRLGIGAIWRPAWKGSVEYCGVDKMKQEAIAGTAAALKQRTSAVLKDFAANGLCLIIG